MKFIALILCACLICGSCQKKKESPPTGTVADYLSDVNYKRLVVQFIYHSGMRPQQKTFEHIRGFLQRHLNKPDGIEFTEKEIPAGGQLAYSLQSVKAIEAAHRTAFTSEGTLAASMIFLDGDYEMNSGNSKVLGLAYGFSSMAIFEKTIRQYSGGLAQPSEATVESSVASHEFGHILGLVNNGAELQAAHQDESHGKHCNNDRCLMYYATETSDIIGNLLNEQVPALDANCVNDLQQAGGK